MFDKKKLNFWRLAVLFLGITVISLTSLWLSPHGSKAEMMDSSMGSMAKDMHLNGLTVYQLLGNHETGQAETGQAQTNADASHHSGQETGMKTMGMLATVIIFLLLPLIIGGSIILALVWTK